MKKTLTLWLILIAFYTNAQTPKPKTTIKYQVTFIKNNKKIVDDICELYLTKNESYFYSYGSVENHRVIDAKLQNIIASGGGNIDLTQKELKSNLYPFQIIKKYTLKKAIVVEEIGDQRLGYIKDSLSTKRWNITNQKKMIGSYVCYKAHMKKDTSLITAWFCKDIPISEGPFYFYGLPGLILQASSTMGWNATVLSIYNTTNNNSKNFGNDYILVTEEKIKKAKQNENADFKEGIQSNGDKLEKSKN
ncbi:GLPGLI family protein [Pedobacter fastidiosus]|uniref:GLPGLI family protein n=1 Tax=Pedobacter fastidiosus TaxID=2765361 RepID=A0ABR7KNE4_9SPHI|nr:GLPGLI family protein [Pedobacter fastidiosus]MBC6109590.1 GLPGLI family protein [Pedobacter fastidiosus]